VPTEQRSQVYFRKQNSSGLRTERGTTDKNGQMHMSSGGMFPLCTHGFVVYELGVHLGFVNVILAEGQETVRKEKLKKQMEFIMCFSISQRCVRFDIDERNW
jgi:hypothetical protein